MSHQLEISFEYGETCLDDSAHPALDLLSGLPNIKDAAHRNLRARNAYIPSRRTTNNARERANQSKIHCRK